MNSKLTRTIFGVLLIQLLVGCSTYTPVLAPNARIDAEAGYVYGRFTLEKPDPTGLFGFRLRAGLVIEEENGSNRYSIQFEPEGVPSVIAVKPGIYVLKKLTFATGDYIPSGEKNFQEGPLTSPFTVDPGKAYYIADFVVATGGSSLGSSVTYWWKLKSVTDNYISTTTDVKKMLPQLESTINTRAIIK